MPEKPLIKKSLLANFKFVLLDSSSGNWQLIKDEEEVKRLHESGELGNGDIVVGLTPEVVRVAEQKNYIELK